jgi:phage tail-like protein
MNDLEKGSSYLNLLPPVFSGGTGFLGRFLTIFELFLTGQTDGLKLPRSFGEILNSIPEYFDPENALPEFIDWLSSRLGLVLKDDWDLDKKRNVLARLIPLYRIRGTKQGLEEYLDIYINTWVTEMMESLTEQEKSEMDGVRMVRIIDEIAPFQVGVTSKIGETTIIDGLPPYYFTVGILFPANPKIIQERQKEIEELIKREKPAHCRFRIVTFVPAMQFEKHSRVGVDTILWETKSSREELGWLLKD